MRPTLTLSVLLVAASLAPAATATAAFPGANGRIAFTCAGDVCTMDADGTDVARLTDAGATSTLNGAPAWSPDGRRIAFERYGPGPYGQGWAIHVMNADGSGQTRLIEGGRRPAWSPSGHGLVYECAPRALCDFFPASGRGKRVTEPPEPEYVADVSPAWSPDGTTIAFASGRPDVAFCPSDACQPGAAYKLHTVRADGSRLTRLPDGGDRTRFGNPNWAPDGRALAFEYQESCDGCGPGGPEDDPPPSLVGRMPYPSSSFDPDENAFAGQGIENHHPAWSPDGTKVAFASVHEGREGIHVVNVDGSGARRLGPGSEPDWQPLGADPPPPPPDSDGDGLPDPSDACPSDHGAESPNGCPAEKKPPPPPPPDDDGDGVPNADDRCPLHPAPTGDGCPGGEGCVRLASHDPAGCGPPGVALVTQRLTASRSGRVRLTITSSSEARLRGTARLTALPRRGLRRTRLAARGFRVSVGHPARVALRLRRAHRRLLARRRALRVLVTIRAANQGGASFSTTPILTLRAPAGRR